MRSFKLRVLCLIGIVCLTVGLTIHVVSAAPPTQFKDRTAVTTRFDLETSVSVSNLETALAGIQATLDPAMAKVNVFAVVEQKVLSLTDTQKIERAKTAIDTLKQAGIATDSVEVKAINQKLFGQDTVPEVTAVAAPPVAPGIVK